jgi:hypothetical protein
MNAIDQALRAIDSARAELHEATVNDRLLLLAHGELASYDEAVEDLAEPTRAQHADLVRLVDQLAAHAACIAAFLEAHGEAWLPHVRTRWAVAGEEILDRAARLREALEGKP